MNYDFSLLFTGSGYTMEIIILTNYLDVFCGGSWSKLSLLSNRGQTEVTKKKNASKRPKNHIIAFLRLSGIPSRK